MLRETEPCRRSLGPPPISTRQQIPAPLSRNLNGISPACLPPGANDTSRSRFNTDSLAPLQVEIPVETG
ncbi:hypothetical protein AB1N83_013667 [Pleurotus pulmonarius]